MSKSLTRKKGGQPGNQNARKHGFFSSHMTPSEICEFWQILKSGHADRELAIFRVKLNSAIRSAPGNRRIFQEASRLLAKWYCSKYGLFGKDKTYAKNVIRYVFSKISKQFSATNHSSLTETGAETTKRIEAETPKSSPSPASKKIFKKCIFTKRIGAVTKVAAPLFPGSGYLYTFDF